LAKTKLQNLRSDPSPTSLQTDGNCVEFVTSFLYLGSLQKSEDNTRPDMKCRILAASVMSSLSRVWRDKILQLSTKIRLYQALVMSVLFYAAETWTLLSCDEKNAEGFPHEVPTPNPAHTLVSACHKRRSIRSRWLTTCYGLHQKTSLVSIRPHSLAHTGLQHTMPYIAKLAKHPVVHLMGTGDVVLVILALAGQINSATTLDLFLPTSGDRPFYGAMVERRDDSSCLRDDDDDDDGC